MLYLRAFIAGITLPTLLLPLFLQAVASINKPDILLIPAVHLIPWLWGVWNILYFAGLKSWLPGSVKLRMLLTGAILGAIAASLAVFWLKIPAIVGFPQGLLWVPFVGAPVVYALLWLFVVHPLNKVVGIPADAE
jgi:hypothetical protein